MRDLATHPFAEIFPMMDRDQYEPFKEDIRKNGLQNCGLLYEGRILDGRNRYRACCELGIEMNWQEVAEEDEEFDAMQYVIAQNLHRRHLSPTQLAMVGGRLKPVYEEQAKERQSKLNNKSALKETFPEATKGQARDKAAAVVKVSGKLVDAATTVLKSGDAELIAKVDAGEVSVTKAAKQVKPPKKKEPKPNSAFGSVKQYIGSLDAADKGCVSEFCEVVKGCGADGHSIVTLLGLVIDWAK